MKILADLDVKGRIQLNLFIDFPENPIKGELCFKENILYIYTSVENVLGWIPLSNSLAKFYVYEQTELSNSWKINHNLNTENIMFQVYDSNNKILLAEISIIDNNNCEIIFGSDEIGKCLIISANLTTISDSSEALINHNKSNTAHEDIRKLSELISNTPTIETGILTLDTTKADIFNYTLTENTTLKFTVEPNKNKIVVLRLTNGATYTLTYPANTKWSGGEIPTLTKTGLDEIYFIIFEDGTISANAILDIK